MKLRRFTWRSFSDFSTGIGKSIHLQLLDYIAVIHIVNYMQPWNPSSIHTCIGVHYIVLQSRLYFSLCNKICYPPASQWPVELQALQAHIIPSDVAAIKIMQHFGHAWILNLEPYVSWSSFCYSEPSKELLRANFPTFQQLLTVWKCLWSSLSHCLLGGLSSLSR